MLFTDKLTMPDKDTFIAGIQKIGADLKINPDLFMLIMHNESGFNPQAVNIQSPSMPGYNGAGKIMKASGIADSTDPSVRCEYRATGLIQFMPVTAQYLGTTTQALYHMTATEQLQYVEKYYTPFHNRIGEYDYSELYLCTFYPAAVGKGDDFILPDFAYRANTSLDMNRDGHISVGEFRAFCKTRIPEEFRNQYT